MQVFLILNNSYQEFVDSVTFHYPNCPKTILAWNLRSSAALASWSKDLGLGGTGLEALSHCTASKKAAVQNLIDVHIGCIRKCVYKYSLYGSNPGTSTKWIR